MKDALAVRAAALLLESRVAALATVSGGVPAVSMVPYAIVHAPLALIVLVSALASHTAQMRDNPSVALMIMEPETPAKPPHTLARVSLQGTASALAGDDPRHGAARATYTARFTDMAGLFALGDFSLFAIEPSAVRVVAGFAQAASVTPASLEQALTHVGRGG